jgi:prepilin-type N-terminal cleavage/methylation domain-containing protein
MSRLPGPFRERPVTDRRQGFTLVEMLFGLVIGALLIGTLFQTLSSTGRFARSVDAREESLQNARTAVELISSELRGILPSGIVVAEANALRFHLPRAWGVLCNPVTAGSGTQTAWVRFPAGVFPASEYALNSHRWGVAVAQTAEPNVNPARGEWRFATNTAAPATANPCVANLGAASGSEERGFSAAGLVPAGSPASLVPAGAFVIAFEQVLYDVAPESAGDPVRWLRRSVGFSSSNTPESLPLAGPLPAATSLSFQYFDATGAELTPANLTTQAGRNTIAQIRLSVTTTSSSASPAERRTASASSSVTFRNR